MGSNRPRSALEDGADRLALLARTVKEQQIAEVMGRSAMPVGDVYSMSPDEVWSRKYMSQGIGPVSDCTAPGGYCPIPFPAKTPVAALAPQIVTAAEPDVLELVDPMPEPVVAAPVGGQIGQAIGKPYRRRSWWSRTPRTSP
jgi:hypothetical protein